MNEGLDLREADDRVSIGCSLRKDKSSNVAPSLVCSPP